MKFKKQLKAEIKQARTELIEAKAIRELLQNNELGAEIHIHGFKMGTCVNKSLLPAVNRQIKELHKFLEGRKNKWE